MPTTWYELYIIKKLNHYYLRKRNDLLSSIHPSVTWFTILRTICLPPSDFQIPNHFPGVLFVIPERPVSPGWLETSGGNSWGKWRAIFRLNWADQEKWLLPCFIPFPNSLHKWRDVGQRTGLSKMVGRNIPTIASPNKMFHLFNEQKNGCACGFWILVHFFAVLWKITKWNDQVLSIYFAVTRTAKAKFSFLRFILGVGFVIANLQLFWEGTVFGCLAFRAIYGGRVHACKHHHVTTYNMAACGRWAFWRKLLLVGGIC